MKIKIKLLKGGDFTLEADGGVTVRERGVRDLVSAGRGIWVEAGPRKDKAEVVSGPLGTPATIIRLLTVQVADFKKMIAEEKNMDVQKLIFLGKILDDDKTLADSGVKETSFVVCMGGPKKAAPAPAPAPPPLAAAPAPAPPVAAPSPPPAEAADGAPAGQPATGPGAPSQENVDQLTAMGFPEQECRAALAAAFNDVTRAAQYLMDPESMPQQPAVPAAATADAEDGGGNAGAGPLDALRQHPQFAQLRSMLQANPQALPQVLQAFGAANPAVAQMIQSNLPAFIELMNSTDEVAPPAAAPAANPAAPNPMAAMGAMGGMPQMNPQMLMQLMQTLQQMTPEQQQQVAAQIGISPEQLQQMAPMLMQQMAQGGLPGMGGPGGGGDPPGMVRIQLSPEDAAAIDRLAELGFDRNECLQAYMACDKNEEMAANFLFTSNDGD